VIGQHMTVLCSTFKQTEANSAELRRWDGMS